MTAMKLGGVWIAALLALAACNDGSSGGDAGGSGGSGSHAACDAVERPASCLAHSFGTRPACEAQYSNAEFQGRCQAEVAAWIECLGSHESADGSLACPGCEGAQSAVDSCFGR